MTDKQRIENATAAREATAASGRERARGTRDHDIEGGLIRYLAAEAYHEKAVESREKKDSLDPVPPSPAP